jgi:hypothetical protein
MRRAAVAVAAVAALAAVGAAPAPAQAIECPSTPLDERIEGADAAFVGRLVALRPAAEAGDQTYRFVVDQPVKGPVGREIEVRAARLTDANGTPLALDAAVGVLAERDGAAWVTGSCSLTDPGALLSTADEPKGDWIKILIGLVILAAVLAYSLRRLRGRRAGGQLPSRRLPGPENGAGESR